MSFAAFNMIVSGESTRHVMSSSASLPLSTILLLTIGSLPLPTRPVSGWC